jgi:hypothetical protein
MQKYSLVNGYSKLGLAFELGKEFIFGKLNKQ